MTDCGYVELHCHTNFSMLDGASHPEELLLRAKELGMTALAATDHDGLYGAVRFWKAAKDIGLRPILGVEITCDGGYHLLLLAKGQAGYSNLCRLVSRAQLRNGKNRASLDLAGLEQHAADLICLSGCRKGEVASHLLAGRHRAALEAATRLARIFGEGNFWIELQNHLLPDDDRLNDELVDLADRLGVGVVATNNVHYALPAGRRLQDVLVCIKNRTTLDASGHLRRPNGEYYLKSAAEMAQIFAAYPGALSNSVAIAERCSADLGFSSYRFPSFPVPQGESPFSYLYKLCQAGARAKYQPITPAVSRQLAHELDVIDRTNLAEYFLIVWDIVRFAKQRGIPCQGRGSAADSIVAYVLDITKVDPIRHNLLFERFLNEERVGMPDIDIDFSTNHREEVIRYVYDKYGEQRTAMVCNVVTYRPRSAVRDVGKALGLPRDLLDRIAKGLDSWSRVSVSEQFEHQGVSGLEQLIALCEEIQGFPRHLSIHLGGMLITAGPLTDVVPLERATAPGRVVTQYNKDDIEEIHLIKIDLLALRTLSVIHDALALIERHHGRRLDLERVPLDDPGVYAMLSDGDTIGAFQVESRAQGQTLPRLQPRTFEDIIITISIIRPGPIQGQMVHPFMRRRQGLEEVTYLHPKLEPILAETLGVVLYQEQVIRIVTAVAGFSAGEADVFRRAMSSHRSRGGMEMMRERFIAGAVANGVAPDVAQQIFQQLIGFAEYGFCKSHAAAFAKTAYDTMYLKLYYTPEFYAAILNNQPMGFYSPEVIVGDAKRHGVNILPVDVNKSASRCDVEGGHVRLGFNYVEGLGEAALRRLDEERKRGPYRGLADFRRRTRLDRRSIENLIAIGAFDSLDPDRRRLLWELGVQPGTATDQPDLRLDSAGPTPSLPALTEQERVALEYEVLGLPVGSHAMELLRPHLERLGVTRSDDLADLPSGAPVRVAGLLVCRQAPPTAKGHAFLTLEDEGGLVNLVLKPAIHQAYYLAIRTNPAFVADGHVQRKDGVTNVICARLYSLQEKVAPSRDISSHTVVRGHFGR